jgi:hypothetical protein
MPTIVESESNGYEDMKALSIRQPWAELILQGRKTIELRTWKTSYRGLLVIHAGYILEEEACRPFGLDPANIVHSALVGTVQVVDIIALTSDSYEALRREHLAPEDWPGGELFRWQLADPRRFPDSVPAGGQPGLYDLPAGIPGSAKNVME